MSEKKMVRRSAAVALGIVCIVLVVVGLVGAVAYIIPMINDKDSTISSLNLRISQLETNNTNLQAQKGQLQVDLDGNESLLHQMQTWLDGNITAYNNYVKDHHHTDEEYNQTEISYQNEAELFDAYFADHHHTDEEYNSLQSIANLENSTVWVNNQPIQQPAGQYTSWTESANYAGYVSVWVQTSSVGGTHVRVSYSSHGVNFDQEIVVSVGGTAVFPILPSTITVEVGNGNQGFQGGASETVTITYYY